MTATLITFTRHLQAGRFPFARMGGEIQMPQKPPDVAAALTKLAEATDVAAAIDTFSPPQPGYRALKAKLAELRGATSRGSRRSCAFRKGRRCGPARKTPACRCCASG